MSGTEVKTGAPLYYGDVLMYPNLGDPVSRTNDKELSFYVSLYPAAGHPVKQVMLELLHNGQRVANGPLTLGKTSRTASSTWDGCRSTECRQGRTS